MHLNCRTANDDFPLRVLIVIVGPTLVNIGAAAVLLRLAGRHSAIAPAGFLALAPARRARVAAVGAVFVSALLLPALIDVSVLVSLLVLVSFISMIRRQQRSTPAEHRDDCKQCE